MERNTRLKLTAAHSVLEFSQLHPAPDCPTTVALVARLREYVDRVRALLGVQLTGRQEGVTARAERNLRIHGLRPRLNGLVRLAQAAAAEENDPTLRLAEGRLATSPGCFLNLTRDVLLAAATHKTILMRHGMPAALLQEMTEELDACEAAHLRSLAQEAACTTAGLEIETIATRTLSAIRHLDALYTLRYSDDPILRAEWQRAAFIAWPRRARPLSADPDPVATIA